MIDREVICKQVGGYFPHSIWQSKLGSACARRREVIKIFFLFVWIAGARFPNVCFISYSHEASRTKFAPIYAPSAILDPQCTCNVGYCFACLKDPPPSSFYFKIIFLFMHILTFILPVRGRNL